MSNDVPSPIRQWIALPSTSCDVRVGPGALNFLSNMLKSSVGSRSCLLVSPAGLAEDVLTEVRHQLSDAGFVTSTYEMPEDVAPRTLRATALLADALEAARITVDDLICVVGDVDLISAVGYVAGSWCGGTQLCQIPTDMLACVEAATTPRGIDVGGLREALCHKPAAKHHVCDSTVFDYTHDAPGSIAARALMVASAIIDSEASFGKLWDRAELIAAGDETTICAQIADTARSRGRVVANTSIATKQSIGFGLTFMHALRDLVPSTVPSGLLIAEGLRFQARISCGMDDCKVDDVLAIDDVLDMLDLPPIYCNVDPTDMVAALKKERFDRTNRFLLELPRDLGRVRPTAVNDDLLLEHATAWCATRAEQA